MLEYNRDLLQWQRLQLGAHRKQWRIQGGGGGALGAEAPPSNLVNDIHKYYFVHSYYSVYV